MDRSTRAFACSCARIRRPFGPGHHGDDLVAFFTQDRVHPRYGTGGWRPWRFWARRPSATWSSVRRRRPAARITARPAPLRLRVDLRDAVRSLLATPGPTTVALVVLTLGIGASTAIFAVVDTVALRGLPFTDPDRLVSVVETQPPAGKPVTVAAPNYVEWIARQHSFEALGASTFFSTSSCRTAPDRAACWRAGDAEPLRSARRHAAARPSALARRRAPGRRGGRDHQRRPVAPPVRRRPWHPGPRDDV